MKRIKFSHLRLTKKIMIKLENMETLKVLVNKILIAIIPVILVMAVIRIILQTISKIIKILINHLTTEVTKKHLDGQTIKKETEYYIKCSINNKIIIETLTIKQEKKCIDRDAHILGVLNRCIQNQLSIHSISDSTQNK